MKRLIHAALAAALLVPGICVLTARAQDGTPPPPPQDGGPSDGGSSADAPADAPSAAAPSADSASHDDAGRGGNRMANRLKRRLGLTDEQAGKFRDAQKAHQEAMKPLGKQVREGMQAVREALKNKASDDEVQKTLDALKAAHKAIVAENENYEAALAAFLTPTQRAKLLVAVEMQMRERRDGGRRGGDHRDEDHHDDE